MRAQETSFLKEVFSLLFHFFIKFNLKKIPWKEHFLLSKLHLLVRNLAFSKKYISLPLIPTTVFFSRNTAKTAWIDFLVHFSASLKMSVQAIQGLPNISLPGPTAFKKRL